MASKKGKSLIEDILDALVDAPWQVGAISTGFFLLLFFVFHKSIFSFFLLLFAGVAIMGTLGSLFKHWRNNKIFDSTNSLVDAKALSWREFEHFVGEYYRRKGFTVTGLGGNGPDGGIDLVAKRGYGEKIIVQCKQWRAYKIPVQVVREVYGVLVDNAASGAAIVTTGSFTQDAIEFSRGKPLELIDGKNLAMMISQIKDAATPAAVFPRKSRAILIPTEPPPLAKEEKDLKYMPPAMRAEYESKTKEFSDAAPLCPHCKKPMVLRVAHKGPSPGSKFWGCGNYPACRHTESLI